MASKNLAFALFILIALAIRGALFLIKAAVCLTIAVAMSVIAFPFVLAAGAYGAHKAKHRFD